MSEKLLSELVIKCPNCGGEVRTGYSALPQEWKPSNYTSNFTHCGICRELLQWDGADAVLKPKVGQ